jgi:hypothetical protein
VIHLLEGPAPETMAPTPVKKTFVSGASGPTPRVAEQP